jgi:predicted DNA-binding transcriptional regulator AlpA
MTSAAEPKPPRAVPRVESRYRLLSVEQVLDLTGWSLVTLDRRQAAGEFPSPIEGGKGKRRRWTHAQYESWAKRKQDAAEKS